MSRILIVEDSSEAQQLIRRALQDSHELSFAANAREGITQAAGNPPDLLLLDAGLPDMNGHEVCSRFKAEPTLASIPIIFLTGQGETASKVMAFQLGAEDYIVKPFDAAELRARVAARLRSAGPRDALLRFSDLEIDPLRQEVRLKLPDRDVPCDLTPHEFRILYCLASQRGSPVTRAQLMEAAWGEVTVSERTIDTHVSNLRKKLAPYDDRLESIRGVGYALAPAPIADTPRPRMENSG